MVDIYVPSNDELDSMLDEAEREAFGVFEDLFAKKTIRSETMTREEVIALEQIVGSWGSLNHYAYLMEKVNAGDEEAVIDCMAAHDLSMKYAFDDLRRIMDGFMRDPEARKLMNEGLQDVGLRLLDPDDPNTLPVQQAQLMIGERAIACVDDVLGEVVEEYRNRSGKK
ncbi:hypothetical protein CVV38_04070 [Candidatus Peregrinibacteria bacterium HGW-Peregrinibacteria-1]|jgi:hypothetical protein|nr:MAG: hypothetical protein CVV38_04070 [Candidatus Peregrinibacteria bacterium HGW-Peregrinibacteria-1]